MAVAASSAFMKCEWQQQCFVTESLISGNLSGGPVLSQSRCCIFALLYERSKRRSMRESGGGGCPVTGLVVFRRTYVSQGSQGDGFTK